MSLTGSSFLDLLDGEQHRFKAFIDSSMASPEPKDSLKRTDTPPANGLRVSLRGSEGVRVAADLYHVPGLDERQRERELEVLRVYEGLGLRAPSTPCKLIPRCRSTEMMSATSTWII